MNIISWNFTNWVTVFLMALVGFVVLRLALDGVARMAGERDDG